MQHTRALALIATGTLVGLAIITTRGHQRMNQDRGMRIGLNRRGLQWALLLQFLGNLFGILYLPIGYRMVGRPFVGPLYAAAREHVALARGSEAPAIGGWRTWLGRAIALLVALPVPFIITAVSMAKVSLAARLGAGGVTSIVVRVLTRIFFDIMLGLRTGKSRRNTVQTHPVDARWNGVPWSMGGAFGVCFGVLASIAQFLPQSQGKTYVLKYELVRMFALASGLGFLIAVLAALLPWVLAAWERGGFAFMVAARFLSARKSGYLTIISVLSILAVTLATMGLCTVSSVMNGFGDDLKRKILNNNAHITANKPGELSGFPNWFEPLKRVRKVPGVVGAEAVVSAEAMASSNASTAGTVVWGIDPARIGQIIDLPKNIEYGKLEYLNKLDYLNNLPPEEVIGGARSGKLFYKGPRLPAKFKGGDDGTKYPGIIIGRELARSLHLLVGDVFTLVSPLGDLSPIGILPRARKFRVAAIFYSGMYEYDATHVYMLRKDAQEFFDLGNSVTSIEIRTANATKAQELVAPVKAAIADPKITVRDWRELNRNLFAALNIEKIIYRIMALVVIVVSCLCIMCTLLLMVREKTKQISILKAMGASNRSILNTFVYQGYIVGAIGAAFGVANGAALCLGTKWFGVRLDPDIYYIDRLPIDVNIAQYLGIGVTAGVVSALVSVLAAYAGASLKPVDGLRHE